MIAEFGGVKIEANTIHIGKKTTFGYNVDIKINGDFYIGDYSHLGDNVKIRGNNIRLGDHLYHSSYSKVRMSIQ